MGDQLSESNTPYAMVGNVETENPVVENKPFRVSSYSIVLALWPYGS